MCFSSKRKLESSEQRHSNSVFFRKQYGPCLPQSIPRDNPCANPDRPSGDKVEKQKQVASFKQLRLKTISESLSVILCGQPFCYFFPGVEADVNCSRITNVYLHCRGPGETRAQLP